MRRLPPWLLLLFLAVPSAAMPPGYFLDRTQALEARPATREETNGEFTLSIQRDCSDSIAVRLLGIAESAYPPRNTLIDLALEKGFEMGSDSAGVPLWWCDGLGERRIPYAVTAGALGHYTRLTELHREGNVRETEAHPLFWSKLIYRARIAPRVLIGGRKTSDSNVYVALLELDWSYDDGVFEQHARAQRSVTLTPEGGVLAIWGDGDAEEETFISNHTGIRRMPK